MGSVGTPSFNWTVSRIIFGLLSALGVMLGIEYSSIRNDAQATASDLTVIRRRIADLEASRQVAEERERSTDANFAALQRRLESIDERLAQISSEVAVLADRSVRLPRHAQNPEAFAR